MAGSAVDRSLLLVGFDHLVYPVAVVRGEPLRLTVTNDLWDAIPTLPTSGDLPDVWGGVCCPVLSEQLRGVVRGGAPLRGVPVEWTTADGELQEFELRARRLPPQARGRDHVVVQLRPSGPDDRSDRAARRRLEATLRDLAGALWEYDVERGTLDFFSEGRPAFLGYARTEFGDPSFWSTIVHPDDLAEHRRVEREAIERKEGFRCEYRARAADGSEVRLLDIVRVFYDGDRPVRQLGITLEVTHTHPRSGE